MTSRILLADDSITIQKVVNLTFADEGIEVVAVSNGDTAEKRLNEIHPDLVLADIFMPGKNGYELCEYIKQSPQFRHVPVVLLVGAFEPFDQVEARRVQADAHLTKPFESRALVETVRELINKSGSAQAAPVAETRPLTNGAPAASPQTPPVTQAWLASEAPSAEGSMAEAPLDPIFFNETFPLDFGEPAAERADSGPTVQLHSLPENVLEDSLLPPTTREHTTAELVSPWADNPPPPAAPSAGEDPTVGLRGSRVPSAFGTQVQDIIVDFDQVEEPQALQPDHVVDFDVIVGSPVGQEEDDSYDTADLEDEAAKRAESSAPVQEPSGFSIQEDRGGDFDEPPVKRVSATALLSLDNPLGDVLMDARATETPEAEDILQVNASLQESGESSATGFEFREPETAPEAEAPRQEFQAESSAPPVVFSDVTVSAEDAMNAEAAQFQVVEGAVAAGQTEGAEAITESLPWMDTAVPATGGLSHRQSADAGWAERRETDFDMVEQPFAEQTASALENADEAEFPTPAMWGSAPEAEAPPPGEPEVGFDFVPVAPSQPEETQEQAAAPPQEATAGAEGSRPVELSEAVIEEIVRRVMARMTDEVVREIAWEVVPECVERVIKEQTRHALTK